MSTEEKTPMHPYEVDVHAPPEEYAQAASEGRFEADIKAAHEAGRTAERADVVAWMREAPSAGPINASQYLARAFQQIMNGAHVGAAKNGVSNG